MINSIIKRKFLPFVLMGIIAGIGVTPAFAQVEPPPPTLEKDHFSPTTCFRLHFPNDPEENILLSGQSEEDVHIDPSGHAADTDGNGLDQVPTELVQLSLTGPSSMGPVIVNLQSGTTSIGQIEEDVNNIPGILDLPPFTPTGTAHSFFDVFFEIDIGGKVLHNDNALRVSGVLHHKPGSTTYPATNTVSLFDTSNNPTGITVVQGSYNTDGSNSCGNPIGGNPGIPEFPIPFSMIIIFVAVAAVYMGIRQKMIPGFKSF